MWGDACFTDHLLLHGFLLHVSVIFGGDPWWGSGCCWFSVHHQRVSYRQGGPWGVQLAQLPPCHHLQGGALGDHQARQERLPGGLQLCEWKRGRVYITGSLLVVQGSQGSQGSGSLRVSRAIQSRPRVIMSEAQGSGSGYLGAHTRSVGAQVT